MHFWCKIVISPQPSSSTNRTTSNYVAEVRHWIWPNHRAGHLKLDKPQDRALDFTQGHCKSFLWQSKLKNKFKYISLIVLTFVICTCTMTFAYGSINMDYVLLLNLNPGNIRGLNQTLNSQGIDIPSPIRTLSIPWCNIVPIDHLTILGRFKSWGYTSCLCRVMECGNRKPCSLGIGNGPVLWTPIGAIGYNLQSEGHVRGYESET